MGISNLFGHSSDYDQGLGKLRAGAATVVVAQDGTGDAAQITDALNLLPPEGGAVYVKAGTYTITSTITLPNANILIQGDGKATKIITTSNIVMISISKANAHIKDVWLYGAGAGNTTNDGILITTGGSSSIIQGCRIENCGGEGIVIEISSGYGDNAVMIENNRLINNIANGLKAGDGASQNVEGVIIRGNYFEGNDRGIYGRWLLNASIIGNVFYNHLTTGTIFLTGDALGGYSSRNTMVGNCFSTNVGNEIRIDNVSCLTNVAVANSDMNGTIAISDAGTGSVIANNI